MASISFSGVFVAPADDLSDTIYLDTATALSGDKSRMGEIRRYAGGRTRYITTPGDVESLEVSQRYTTQAAKNTLRALVGQVVLVRSGRGDKVYGALQAVRHTEITGSQELVDISFSVTSVTHSEEV
jgi:hypothetical protein